MKSNQMFNVDNAHPLAIQWAREELESRGYTLQSDIPEIVQTTPWSYVVRFHTTSEIIYLKQTPELIALEASIIQMLHHKWNAPVPVIIANNTPLHCFLMKDAGKTLRSIFKQSFDPTLMIKAIDLFASLQCSVSEGIDEFIQMGVPDWRLSQMPNLFKDLISNHTMLLKEGLSEEEVRKLDNSYPVISSLCNQLSEFKIQASIVQPDFNDNNTLIDDRSQKITFIDLGEIAISHPFFPLMNCLHILKKYHGLSHDHESTITIKNAYLNHFLKFEPQHNCLKAFELAQKLWYVYGILAHHRLMQACGQNELKAFGHGGQSGSLARELMMLCQLI